MRKWRKTKWKFMEADGDILITSTEKWRADVNPPSLF